MERYRGKEREREVKHLFTGCLLGKCRESARHFEVWWPVFNRLCDGASDRPPPPTAPARSVWER